MKPIFFLFPIYAICFVKISAQAELLSLEQAIALSHEHAVEAALARNKLTNQYWMYQSFLAELKPKLVFLSNPLPSFNRMVDVITLPDGSDAFVKRSLMRSNVELKIEQYIGSTGGRIYASSGLQRIDLFGTRSQKNYFSTPINFGISQPFLQFDPIAWEKKRKPLEYEKSKLVFQEEIEALTLQTVTVFFDLLAAQLDLDAAYKAKGMADTLSLVAEQRNQFGKMTASELLQIKLNVQNAEVAIAKAKVDVNVHSDVLSYLIGNTAFQNFTLVPPDHIPELEPNYDALLKHAYTMRSDRLDQELRMLEAEMQFDQTSKKNGFKINLVGTFGLSQTGTNLRSAFNNLLDQEQLFVSLELPIADWGKARSDKEMARSNLQLSRTQINAERLKFEREIYAQIQQLQLFQEKYFLALESQRIANSRKNMAMQRYAIGKVGIVEFNLAMEDSENARLNCIHALKDFWTTYYKLRKLTLFDLISGRSLF